MALKQQHQMMATFSMASMTDIIFLLLIFFMVTSTFVTSALEVNLPQQSTEQTALKPTTRVYVKADMKIYASFGDEEPAEMSLDQLYTFLNLRHQEDAEDYVAVYADEAVPYGKIVEILEQGAKNNMKMVLATKAVPANIEEESTLTVNE